MITIGGLQKVTLIDFPGKIAAAVFLAGCNFRCPYCHNPALVKAEVKEEISLADLYAYLAKRKNVLEGVCVSGGEPLLYAELEDFLRTIKKLGYALKLDTNGSQPDFLARLISQQLVDYLAMDIKTSLDDYSKVCGVKVDVNKIKQSIDKIMNSGLDYEFRTTVLPKFHNLKNIVQIAKLIKGARAYYLQNFNNRITLDGAYQGENSFTEQDLLALKNAVLPYVPNCQIRGEL